ncbi:MAG: SH3 domain-containing protein [Chloroflexota bacterium]
MLSSLKKKNALLVVIVAVIAFLLGLSSTSLLSGGGSGLGGAAGVLDELTLDCDLTPLSNEDPTGIVLADPLNFRIGPGLEFDIIRPLEICTPVIINGRTGDYAWLLVTLPGNQEGWVFSGYIKANVNYGDLDIATGFGGANTDESSGNSSSSQNVSVIIEGNQAAAFIYGMPANQAISATLSPIDGAGGKSVSVANGQLDSDGNTALTFSMPTTWADGSALESGTMTLTLVAGGETLTAFITYYIY